ncbi:hypothetical protein ACWD5R_40855 [Streptomyces sp. NPDC002514]|uniref:hypothetical protein n=1 Tax=unclassified Streptomyces TaxID=2593676 RepID=UPI0036B4414F
MIGSTSGEVSARRRAGAVAALALAVAAGVGSVAHESSAGDRVSTPQATGYGNTDWNNTISTELPTS